jgi:diguanylate cyclase
VQRRLQDVIFKQTEAKGRMVEAQDQMKEMLATFIERLSAMTDASSGYQNKMERYAERIASQPHRGHHPCAGRGGAGHAPWHWTLDWPTPN